MTVEPRIAQLRAWDAAYAADDPQVSDAVYDAYRDVTLKMAPSHPYFKDVGAAPVSAWPKAKHTAPMGSLNKVQTPAEMRAWLARVGNPEICMVEKLDGISIALEYIDGRLARAVTRGDGTVGEDITANVRKMRGVPERVGFTGRVRGEIILQRSVFNEYFNDYKNCRNAAGGAAKDLNGSKCHLLTVMCYEILPDSGSLPSKKEEMLALERKFVVPRWEVFSVHAEVLTNYNMYVNGLRAAIDHDIDGLVLFINDTEARDALGETNQRPAGAVAFKFPADAKETALRDIVWQVGASGRITPVAVFDPVELAGVTVQQASLHNVSNIVRLWKEVGFKGIHLPEVGDTIIVSRRNDVIPYVESLIQVNDGRVLSFPTTCPSCGVGTKMDGEYLICPNKHDCEAQVAGAVKRWIVKLGIKDFGGALVEALCDAGKVASPADLYKLTAFDLASLQFSGRRVGESTAKTAMANLRARTEIPIHVLVGSLGIPLWSRSMVKVLVQAGYDSIFKMQDATLGELVKIPGVDVTKAQAFIDGLRAVLPEIKRLLDAGITIAPEAVGLMKGKSVCLTGFRDADMDAAIEAAGGTMKSSVGKGLTYLVAKSTTGSSGKLDKARSLGVQIVSADEMWAMLRQ